MSNYSVFFSLIFAFCIAAIQAPISDTLCPNKVAGSTDAIDVAQKAAATDAATFQDLPHDLLAKDIMSFIERSEPILEWKNRQFMLCNERYGLASATTNSSQIIGSTRSVSPIEVFEFYGGQYGGQYRDEGACEYNAYVKSRYTKIGPELSQALDQIAEQYPPKPPLALLLAHFIVQNQDATKNAFLYIESCGQISFCQPGSEPSSHESRIYIKVQNDGSITSEDSDYNPVLVDLQAYFHCGHPTSDKVYVQRLQLLEHPHHTLPEPTEMSWWNRMLHNFHYLTNSC